ncbi:MAG: S9 family peptidase [Acidimicrobiia bacterium]
MPEVRPPLAPRRPTVLRTHGDERIDEWYWLRERDDPEVLAYLRAENEFAQAGLAHTEDLQRAIFDEIKARVVETDASAPVRRGDHEYFTRTVEGLEYSVHCRRPIGSESAPDPRRPPGATPGEEVLLDENALAAGSPYFALRNLALSPGHTLLAHAVDLDGGERATLRFRDLSTGEDLDDEVPDTYYGIAWANDDRTVFYVRPDAAMRPWQVWRHMLGTAATDDSLVFEEPDERFSVHISRARTGRFLLIGSHSKVTSEVLLVDADAPTDPPVVVSPRTTGIEYHVEHHHPGRGHPGSGHPGSGHPGRGPDVLYLVTNEGGAENFRLAVTDVAAIMAGDVGPTHWREVVPHRPDVRLEAVDAFADCLVLSERSAGLEHLRVLPLDGDREHIVELPDDVYSVWVGPNPEYETAVLRIGYTSLVLPPTDFDVSLTDGTRTVVKTQPVQGYDPADYETHRHWVDAPDGAQIPLSLVHRRDLPPGAPFLLNGYGAYEVSLDPMFAVTRVSLLERGIGFAIAHVRGGGELGRAWYEGGRLGNKRNTFTDFVACAQHLVDRGITRPDRLAASGGSAGGLLMGAVANLRPDLFRAIVAEVPFVDCLTTILDPSLPLTITEWDEWGDPVRSREMYAYIKGYAPYDNVVAQDYPALLVTGGLNDPRVQYWEPAKWVAKLRVTATGDRPVYLKTELDAGHHGPSGRYGAWRERALVLAFVIDQIAHDGAGTTGRAPGQAPSGKIAAS